MIQGALDWLGVSLLASVMPHFSTVLSLGSLGAGSDYASFIHYLGITSMDLAYTYDRVTSLSAPPGGNYRVQQEVLHLGRQG